MSMNKRVTIPMETSAYYQSISNLNVQFWNQDKGVAELQFLITRNNFPLPLSNENVQIVLALESGESFITTDDVDIINEVEGVASYIIPQEFMAVANEVTGQIYVATLDGDEVVVQRKFTFTVENDLLSSIPSEEKLRYIKMFSELQQVMSDRLGGLETALTQLEQNVADVNNARQAGITAINNLYDAKLVTFNQNYDDKMALINNAMNDMETYVDTSLADMTAKKTAFDSSVSGSGLVTTGQSKDWQKHKLTEENSQRIRISDIDPVELDSGFYQMWRVKNAPIGSDNNTQYWNIDITSARDGVKQIVATISSSGRTYKKNVHKNVDSGWKEVPFIDENNSFETVQGSSNKANTAENNARTYTDTKINQEHSILFSGSVNGVNNTVNLTGSMNDYEFIIISGDCAGNDFSQIVVPSITGSIVNMQNLNLRDTDGMLLGAYEVRLEITSTTIKITNDVAYDNPSDTGSGPNRNAYTIVRVEGVHKK